jgi:hypothetical protein
MIESSGLDQACDFSRVMLPGRFRRSAARLRTMRPASGDAVVTAPIESFSGSWSGRPIAIRSRPFPDLRAGIDADPELPSTTRMVSRRSTRVLSLRFRSRHPLGRSLTDIGVSVAADVSHATVSARRRLAVLLLLQTQRHQRTPVAVQTALVARAGDLGQFCELLSTFLQRLESLGQFGPRPESRGRRVFQSRGSRFSDGIDLSVNRRQLLLNRRRRQRRIPTVRRFDAANG